MSLIREASAQDVSTEIPCWVDDMIVDDVTEAYFIIGGLGSGKTHGAGIAVYDHIALNSDSKLFWAVAPTHKKVEDILIPSFQEALSLHYGLEPSLHYRIVKSPYWKIIFNARAPEVHFLSGDRPENFVGTNICGFWITEPGIQKHAVFEKVNQRMRCPKANRLRGFVEGTPEGMNWLYDEADNNDYIPENDYRFIHKNYDLPVKHPDRRPYKRFTLETWDNPNPNIDLEAYVARIIRTIGNDKTKIKSYVYGHFVPFAQGNCYDFVHSRDVVLADDLEINPYSPLLLCFDFNYFPLSWTLMQRRRVEDRKTGRAWLQWIVLKEATGEETFLADSVAEFVTALDPDFMPGALPHKYQDTPIHIYGDNSGFSSHHRLRDSDYEEIQKLLVPYFKDVQIRAANKNPRIKTTVGRVNKCFMYELLAVSSACPNTIMSFQKTAFKPDTWEILKPQGEMITHWSDSIRPAIFQLSADINFESPHETPILGRSF